MSAEAASDFARSMDGFKAALLETHAGLLWFGAAALVLIALFIVLAVVRDRRSR